MRRILVLGSSGSGKTTFASRLSNRLGVEAIHLDYYYWRSNWVEPSQAEWEQILIDLLGQESWVMDGNYTSSLPLRLRYADAVIFLDFGRLRCFWRVFRRFWRYRGGNRPELPPGCDEKIDLDFVKWIWGYPRRIKPRVMAALQESGLQTLIFLKGPGEVKAFLENLEVQ